MTAPEVKASPEAIERAAEELNATNLWGPNYWTINDYDCAYFKIYANKIQRMSDALRAEHGDNVPASLAGFVLPVVVDPIVEAARRICAACAPSITEFYLAGRYDDETQMVLAIAELRAIAAQGGGK